MEQWSIGVSDHRAFGELHRLVICPIQRSSTNAYVPPLVFYVRSGPLRATIATQKKEGIGGGNFLSRGKLTRQLQNLGNSVNTWFCVLPATWIRLKSRVMSPTRSEVI